MTLTLADATIVIVEDDENSLMASAEMLRMHGVANLYTFTNGEKAMAFLESAPAIDLFLVDIHMPGETGYDFIKRVKDGGKLGNAKVAALTAGVLVDDIRRARAAGFNGFIGKPIRPMQFPGQINRILAGERVWES